MSEPKRERITREVIVKDYEYMDGGKNARKEIIAVYYSPTNAEAKAEREKIRALLESDPNAMLYASDELVNRLHELRDAETGKALYEITLPNLEGETNHNLQLIQDAIKEDISPKSTPAK